MKDSELLELAAKAAGYESFGISAVDGVSLCIDPVEYTPWNPLKNDGNALRLAVKLDIHIMRYGDMTTARKIFELVAFDERDDGDAFAATRRAIVREAAEIGRAMK